MGVICIFGIVDMNSIIRKSKKKKNGLSGQMLMYCVVGLVVLLMAIALVQSQSTLREKQAELDAILAQCDMQQMENDALEDLMNNSDAEYIERKAREELDYVLPGERVYIIKSGN